MSIRGRSMPCLAVMLLLHDEARNLTMRLLTSRSKDWRGLHPPPATIVSCESSTIHEHGLKPGTDRQSNSSVPEVATFTVRTLNICFGRYSAATRYRLFTPMSSPVSGCNSSRLPRPRSNIATRTTVCMAVFQIISCTAIEGSAEACTSNDATDNTQMLAARCSKV